GGGDRAAGSRGGAKRKTTRGRCQLPAEANPLPGLCPLPPRSPADRQRGDGSGVQDGIHATDEAVGDDLEWGDRAADLGPPVDPLKRSLDGSVSSVLTVEDASRDGDSSEYS